MHMLVWIIIWGVIMKDNAVQSVVFCHLKWWLLAMLDILTNLKSIYLCVLKGWGFWTEWIIVFISGFPALCYCTENSCQQRMKRKKDEWQIYSHLLKSEGKTYYVFVILKKNYTIVHYKKLFTTNCTVELQVTCCTWLHAIMSFLKCVFEKPLH